MDLKEFNQEMLRCGGWSNSNRPHIGCYLMEYFVNLTPSAVVLYHSLIENQHISKDGQTQYPFCKATYRKLARINKISIMSVMRLIRELIKKGLLIKVKIDSESDEGVLVKYNTFLLVHNFKEEHSDILDQFRKRT